MKKFIIGLGLATTVLGITNTQAQLFRGKVTAKADGNGTYTVTCPPSENIECSITAMYTPEGNIFVVVRNPNTDEAYIGTITFANAEEIKYNPNFEIPNLTPSN